MPHKYIVFVVFLISFAFDRVAKFFADANLLAGEVFTSPGGVFSVTKVYNTGAAFGILQGQTAFLLVFSALVLLTLGIYVFRWGKKLGAAQKVSFGLILGGIAGNLFDRIFFGHVVDFIKLGFVDFPVFNLADIFINLGVALLLSTLFFCKPASLIK